MEQFNRISPCIKAELKNIKPLKRAEEKSLFNEYSSSRDEKRKQEIFDKIITSNLKFVFAMANQQSKECKVSLDDLFAEGKIGLIEAFHKYDPSIGTKFISFAVHYIKRALYTCVSTDDLVRIPIALKTNVAKKRKLGEEEAFSEREAHANSVMMNVRQAMAGNDESETDCHSETPDVIHDDIGDIETTNLKEVFWKMLQNSLTTQELYIVQYSYGLQDGVILPARDIATNLRMKQSDFQKVKKSAQEKMKKNKDLHNILLEVVNA